MTKYLTQFIKLGLAVNFVLLPQHSLIMCILPYNQEYFTRAFQKGHLIFKSANHDIFCNITIF